MKHWDRQSNTMTLGRPVHEALKQTSTLSYLFNAVENFAFHIMLIPLQGGIFNTNYT